MYIVSADDIDKVLDFPALVETLRTAFTGTIDTPLRHHHTLPAAPGAAPRVLLLMPAWPKTQGSGYFGTKLVTVFPDNPSAGHPTVQGTYILFSDATGAPVAALDGTRITLWRTAAASALAATYLARRDASRLAMMGAGAMAPFLIRAHAAVRPISHVTLWNRNRAKADALAATLAHDPFEVSVTDDPQQAVAQADIVSSATVSSEPIVRGAWVKPGTHVDLIGAYREDLRESDDELIAKCALFADTRAGAFGEAGDILQPLKAGAIGKDALLGDLFDLAGGKIKGRSDDRQITVFKSVGTALEDLAAAEYVFRRFTSQR